MELRHLRYFVVVAQEGNFTRAAERLCMQQPPLSQQIRALEDELGFNLFIRHPKGAVLSPGGLVFFREAQAILESVTKAGESAARVALGIEGELAIGITSSVSAHPLIPQVIGAYRQAYPNVYLSFEEGNAAELTEAVLTQKIDVAFLRLPVTDPGNLNFLSLLDEDMLVVLPLAHRLVQNVSRGELTSISLRELQNEKFILVRRPGAPGMYANLIDACHRLGFTAQVVMEAERIPTAICLVAAGVGVTAVPASMRGLQAHSVAYCRISDDVPELRAPLMAVTLKSGAAPAVQNFLAQAEMLAQSIIAS